MFGAIKFGPRKKNSPFIKKKCTKINFEWVIENHPPPAVIIFDTDNLHDSKEVDLYTLIITNYLGSAYAFKYMYIT